MSDILADDSEVRGDLKMVQTAIKQRWPITDEMRQLAAERLQGLLASPDDRTAAKAAQVLLQMDTINQRDEHHKEDLEAKQNQSQLPRHMTQFNFASIEPEQVYELLERFEQNRSLLG